MERAIHISSINREKTGENRPDNFLIKFNPPLNLNPEMKHSLAIDRLTMTYSWYNIRSSYKNNTIKYSNDRGVNWNTATFKDGMYSYTDINNYLKQYMEQKNQHTTDQQGNKVFHININFILSTYRVLISFSDDKFQLDLRGTNFGELIGFEKKLITKTEYGTILPNITNSIDVLNINTNAIKDSIVDGVNTNTIAMIPTDNLTRSYPFTFEPRRPLYCPVSSNMFSEMRFYVTDSLGRPVDFNGIDWFMTLLLHSRQYHLVIKYETIRFKKKKYDPELGRFTRQHIYGEGVMDVFKNIGSKVIGQTLKKAAKTAASKAVTTAATKTGEHVGKKAGDKISQMLSKSSTPKKVRFDETVSTASKPGEEIVKILSKSSTPLSTQQPKRMTQQEINQRLNLILSDD